MEEQWIDEQLGKIKIVRNQRARNIIMRVTPDCIRVTCPPYAPIKEVRNIIDLNRDKIARQKQTVKSRTTTIDQNFRISTDLLQLNIVLRPQTAIGSLANEFTANRKKGQCTIVCPHATDFASIQEWLKKIIIEELRIQAKTHLPQRTHELAQTYGFHYKDVKIQSSRTNWGSCSTKSNINLNLNIVRLPYILRDYILLHELCHLRHHDHGQAFHLLLEHVCTDNLLRLCDQGDMTARQIARVAASSRARYPIDHVCTKAIKQYPLI